MEKKTLYKMGKKFEFLVIIIGKTCYHVKICDNTWEFFRTYDPGPYGKTMTIARLTTITGTQHSQSESTHIRKLDNYKQFLGANRAAWELITCAINSHE